MIKFLKISQILLTFILIWCIILLCWRVGRLKSELKEVKNQLFITNQELEMYVKEY